jgi:tetratricopeptide (TPR) repeat protein
MRKLAALLLAVTLLAPALALAQDQPGTPAPGGSTQPQQPTIALAAPGTLDRAIAAVNANQFDQAVLDSSVFILMNPSYARGYYVRGVAYEALNRLPEALADLNKAVPLSTGSAAEGPILEERARLYIGNNQLPEALADLTSAIKISPTGDLYTLRAQTLMQQNDYPSALKDLNEAIKLSPDNGALLLLRATIYDALNNPPEAAADYLSWISSQQPQETSGQPISASTQFRVTMAAAKAFVVPVNLKKGQKLSVAAAHVNGTVDPLLVLLDPNNQPLVANDDTSATNQNSLISNFAAPADGQYILVISYAGGGTDGQVAVQIRIQ